MSEKHAAHTAQSRLPIGEDITFEVWSDELAMFIHVTRQEAEWILTKRPQYEFTQEIFGVVNPSMAFLQKRKGAA